MKERQSIGSVTFFVNAPRERQLSPEEIEQIQNAIVSALEDRIQKADLGDQVFITDVVSRRGCVITTVSLAAVFWGAATFLRDYEKVREGAVKLAEDLNGLAVRVADWTKDQTIWFYRSDEPEPRDDEQKSKAKKPDSD